MKLFIGFALMVGMLLFTGCAVKKEDIFLKMQYETVEVVEIDPPKHFNITIKYQDGTSESLYGGKYCSEHENLSVGQNVQVNVKYYKRDGYIIKRVEENACEIAKSV